MSEAKGAREHYLALHAGFAPGESAPWLEQLRARAIAAFGEAGLPHAKQEEWRYTSLARLAKLRPERPTVPGPAPAPDRLALVDAVRLVFVDGFLAPELSSTGELPGGARAEGLRRLCQEADSPLEGRLGALLPSKEHPFADLNTAFLDDGAAVLAPAKADLDRTLHLVFASTSPDPAVVFPRVLIVAEEGSRLRVVQDHLASSAAAAEGLTDSVTEIHAGPNAEVEYVLLQREPAGRFHVSNLAVRQERSSRVKAHTLTLGGAWTRNDAGFVLADEGAECTLNGLFVGTGSQLIDNHTWVDHAMPHCESHELYRGILGGGSRGVFRGRVVVRPDAQKTNATQSNPNLLLGRKAEIDTKPQLEIYADDVKCSHGSTVGQLDGNSLFYLQSRGIAEDDARDLLTRAFATEILDALAVPGLGDALEEILAERLVDARREESP